MQQDLLAAVTSATKLVALTHASNVTGAIQPVEAVAEGNETLQWEAVG